jgi:cytosine/adenosine deaminase-related metal-dependent hydrolase
MQIKSGIAIVGENLDIINNVCININEDGIIESIEKSNNCNNYIGNENLIAIPQPANAHVHSGDNSFPEYGVKEELHELVAYPNGLKHKLLSSLSYEKLIGGISSFYSIAYNMGIGLVVDFREGGGIGCKASKEAQKYVKDMDVVVLGRPGPDFPNNCDGLGISSPIDYKEDYVIDLSKKFKPSMTHIAEDEKTRKNNDFEIAMKSDFNAFIHGLYLNEKDFENLSHKNIYLIFCPSSNMWHGMRFPPVELTLKYNIKFAIGTDNASWFLPDVFRETYELLLILRLNRIRGEEVAKELMKSLYINGYKSIGLEPRLIEEGKTAHFLLIDGYNSGIINSINIYNSIIKRVQPEFIKFRIDKNNLKNIGLFFS